MAAAMYEVSVVKVGFDGWEWVPCRDIDIAPFHVVSDTPDGAAAAVGSLLKRGAFDVTVTLDGEVCRTYKVYFGKVVPQLGEEKGERA